MKTKQEILTDLMSNCKTLKSQLQEREWEEIDLGGFEKKVNRIVEDEIFSEAHRAKFQTLTPREVEIVGLMAAGHSNQDIADELYISKNTVATHRKNLLRKLEVSHWKDVLRYARAFDLF